MKLKPIDENPPYLYNGCPILRRPNFPLTFEKSVDRIIRFKRGSVIFFGISILWKLWNGNHAEPTGKFLDLVHLLKCQTSYVINIACFWGRKKGRPEITEKEFSNLVWEYTLADNSLETDKEDIVETNQSLATYFEKHEANVYLSKVAKSDLSFLRVCLYRSRLAENQWRGIFYSHYDWVRSILVYKEFREISLKEIKQFSEFEASFLGTSYERFYRCCACLFGSAINSSKVERHVGVVDLGYIKRSKSIKEKFDITDEDIEIVCRKLSTPLSNFREIGEKIKEIPEHLRKYSNQMDWLNIRPLIEVDEENIFNEKFLDKSYLLPDPWKYLNATQNFTLVDLVESSSDLIKQNLYNIRGRAFANYMRIALKNKPFLYDCDVLFENSVSKGSKKPDFIWYGKKFCIFIECKFGTKSNNDTKLLHVTSILEAWRRSSEGIDQVQGFLKYEKSPLLDNRLIFSKDRIPIMIICTNDLLIEESSGFLVAAKKWDFLDKTDIKAIGTLSASEIEYVTTSKDPDEVGENILNIWNSINPLEMDLVIRDHALMSEITKSNLPQHLKEAWSYFWGG